MLFRRLIAAVALLCAIVAPAMAQKTKAQLNTEIGVSFPDNTAGFITPALLRGVTQDIVNSTLPTAPVVSGNLACFNGTTGLLQDCGQSPATIITYNQVASIAALKVSVGGFTQLINVLGYYGVNDNGGGLFSWDASNVSADNGGTIIAPNAGGTGRWVRQTPFTNRYTPEMFGARHNGTDDQTFVNNAVSALSALPNGGTLWLTDGYIYTVGPSLATAQATVIWAPKVNFDGYGTLKLGNNTNATVANGGSVATFTGTCTGTSLAVSGVTGTIHIGDFLFGAGMPAATSVVSGTGPYVVSTSCTSSGAALTATTKFVRMVEAVNPTNVSHVSMQNITLDYNGVNNMCAVSGAGTCWGFNALASIQVGDDITIQNVKFFNNSGSNDLEFGNGISLPPSVTNLKIIANTHENSGDRINVAAADWSADFWIASNVTHRGNSYSNGPTVNGSAIEIHGNQVSVTGNVVRDYFNCMIVSNEVNTPSTANVTISSNTCLNVNYGGVQIASRPSAITNNVSITSNIFQFLTTKAGWGVDACSLIDPSSTNVNLSINNNIYYSDQLGNLSNDTSPICASSWVSVTASGNQFYNTQGPGIHVKTSLNSSAYNFTGNQFYSPGLTSTTALQAGVVIDATGGITATNINIRNNPVTGAVRYAVIGAQNATGGYVEGNAPGASIDQVLWTGTGAVAIPKFAAGAYTVVGDSAAQTITNKTGVQSSSFQLAHTFASSTAPSIAGGFCTSPSISANNGTAAFAITIGSACAAGTGTLTLPAATTNWVCNFADVTAPGTNSVIQTGGTTTTVTVQNYSRTTGATANFGSGDVVRASCMAY